MTRVPLILIAASLAGCASASRPPTATDPELFRDTYAFSGTVNGHKLEGRFWFRQIGDPVPIELNMMSAMAGNCRSEVRVLNKSNMVLHCGAIQLQFLQRGQLVERPAVAWTRVQQQQRRGCVRWAEATRGQRRCAQYGPETVDVPVTMRGSVQLTRVKG